MDCIFCKIRDRKIPAKFVYEDDAIMVFPDIHPIKPIHLLIVPKQHIADFFHIDDTALMEKVRVVLQKMIQEQELETKGYRITVNGGGAQEVQHLHIHLTGPLGKAAIM